jgi:hypothetical protein
MRSLEELDFHFFSTKIASSADETMFMYLLKTYGLESAVFLSANIGLQFQRLLQALLAM